MTIESWMLPEGVDELLPPESGRLEQLRRLVLDLFFSWGYELVMPPFMDYVESLLTGTGSDLDLQTFKVIDQSSGKLMGVRADMTPQVARIDARRLQSDGPTRLCYVGTVLRTVADSLGGSRIPIQVGAELYGHRGVESDCEVVSLMLDTLQAAGVSPVHLDLGHVGVFRGLIKQAGLDVRAEAKLHDGLQRKAIDELAAAEELRALDPKVTAMLVGLAELNGEEDVINRARRLLAGADDAVHACLDELDQLAAALTTRAGPIPMHFDLAELRGYRYHTGVVFAALVPGFGREVARGGRYDEIGNVFGRARPATGFSTDLKQLLALGGPQADTGSAPVYAPWSDEPGLLDKISALRAEGRRVILTLPGAESGHDAPSAQCLRSVDGVWQVDSARSEPHSLNSRTRTNGSMDGV